jgi:hypothetical protein
MRFACRIAFVLLATGLGCGRTGAEADSEAAGGSSAQSGGSSAQSGGSSAQSGGSSAQSGGSSAQSAGALSIDEWRELTKPQPGHYAVWLGGCEPTLLETDGVVIPNVGCQPSPNSRSTLNCDVIPYCRTSADCTKEPGGRCDGFQQQAICYFPDESLQTCGGNEDCVLHPGGKCEQNVTVPAQCYPTGECQRPPFCVYDRVPCDQDGDCTGGYCLQNAVETSCSYVECTVDADCDKPKRCGCSECVPAECDSDASCPDGETCELSGGCSADPGYFCTTPNDTCQPGVEPCVYSGNHWRQLGLCE